MDEPKARSRRKRKTAPTTPDPVEIAMEIAATGKTPADAAMAVLHANAALLTHQGLLARNEIFRNRIRAVRDFAIAVVVVALIPAAGATVWSASRTSGLVIQPFSVPPELVEDGLDGHAVAALFQDELIRLEAATNSARPASSFRNDWSEAITVEVVASGLSLTDAYTSLTQWLSQETYVGGGLSRTTGQLELVVRTSDGVVVRAQGRAGRPGDLIRQAAEQLYEQTQPYRYAIYVGQLARALPAGPERQAEDDRRQAILKTLLSSPSELDRIWGHIGLSRSLETTVQEAITLLEVALELDPDHPMILTNLVVGRHLLGHDEAALMVAHHLAKSLSAPRNLAKVSEETQIDYPLVARAILADSQGDWLQALELRTSAASRISTRLALSANARDRVDTLLALHQPAAALSLNESLKLEERSEGHRAGTRALYLPLAEAAASLDQWQQAAEALEAWDTERGPSLPLRFSPAQQTYLWPRLAYARARIGDLAGARALIAATPLDCYPCVRERARIAELSGDRPAADRWSAEARRIGPSLPFAFAERGQMPMGRGDPAGAIAFYEQAVERGPRWADPQKYWGDALMARGDEAGAIRKYRAAADRAPQWGALHLAWGRALEAQGKRDQAREKYTEAARMDLSAADRAEVVRRLGAAVRPRG